jgi:hypothetical protein
MEPRKIGIALLALLLAAMAIVPIVSAADACQIAANGKEDLGCTVARIAAGQTRSGPEGNDAGMAIEKIVATGPLSPAGSGIIKSDTGTGITISPGSTIEHILAGEVPVTIVYDKDGRPQYWADDREAPILSTFRNKSLPSTRIHEIPADAVIDHTSPGVVIVTDPETKNILLKIKDSAGTRMSQDPDQSLVGICSENKGCYIADIYGNDAFTSLAFDRSLDYYPKFTRAYDEKTGTVKMSVCKSTPDDPYNCTDEKYSTGLSARINPDSASFTVRKSAPVPLIQLPCGWVGVSPSISSSGMAVTFGSWINWVWNPLAGVPTINVDFQNQLYRDLGSGHTQLIKLGKYKSYTGVGLVGVTDTNTYTVSSAGNYFDVTVMDWQVPGTPTCIPASGSGMFQTYPNLPVP